MIGRELSLQDAKQPNHSNWPRQVSSLGLPGEVKS